LSRPSKTAGKEHQRSSKCQIQSSVETNHTGTG
jgi:hypothetical protein